MTPRLEGWWRVAIVLTVGAVVGGVAVAVQLGERGVTPRAVAIVLLCGVALIAAAFVGLLWSARSRDK